MESKNEKRVLNIELDDDVKRVSITGLGDDEKVVMKQELSEDELEQATGGKGFTPTCQSYYPCSSFQSNQCTSYSLELTIVPTPPKPKPIGG